VAIVWGPLGGYFAEHGSGSFKVTPVQPIFDGPQLPMIFDISMAVRKDDEALRQEIDAALVHRRADVNAILASYGVPRFDRTLKQAEHRP
jgi:mxaJ protein